MGGIKKIAQSVNNLETYWKRAPEGRYMPFKELASLAAGGFGFKCICYATVFDGIFAREDEIELERHEKINQMAQARNFGCAISSSATMHIRRIPLFCVIRHILTPQRACGTLSHCLRNAGRNTTSLGPPRRRSTTIRGGRSSGRIPTMISA